MTEHEAETCQQWRGMAGRMERLRAVGNAISPQVAEAFIGAYLESRRWQDGGLGA